MNVKVDELMTASVVSAQPHQSVEHVRGMLHRNSISSVPVVDSSMKFPTVTSSRLSANHDWPKLLTSFRYRSINVGAALEAAR